MVEFYSPARGLGAHLQLHNPPPTCNQSAKVGGSTGNSDCSGVKGVAVSTGVGFCPCSGGFCPCSGGFCWICGLEPREGEGLPHNPKITSKNFFIFRFSVFFFLFRVFFIFMAFSLPFGSICSSLGRFVKLSTPLFYSYQDYRKFEKQYRERKRIG